MAEMTVIEPVVGEGHNLELHTELCAQRYNQLIAKFDEVDGRLTKIESMLVEIREQVGLMNTTKLEVYLKWAGVVIMTLTAFISGLISYIVTVI
jgi:hypothetical protein